MSELEPAVNPTPDLETAQYAFAAFIGRLPQDGRIVGLHDVDADGLSAGALWQRALERLGFASVTRLVPDRDWIAAVGLVGDLGERAPFPLLESAKKKHKAKYLKEATALVNAPRRSSRPDPEAAARALLSHPDPRALANSGGPDVAVLRAAREEVKAAMEEAKKAAPVFAGKVALIRLHSPCQVHPLIAQIWRSRLPQFIVIAANDGYLPGRVNFSARSRSEINVLEFLRAADIGEGEGSFGHGHDQASGGSLPVARWNALLAQWGFAS